MQSSIRELADALPPTEIESGGFQLPMNQRSYLLPSYLLTILFFLVFTPSNLNFPKL